MGLFENFPYTNIHELNLDWLIEAVKNINIMGLPVGGRRGQVLAKSSDEDFNTEWVDDVGVPAGGTTGQVLAKASNADYDAEWIDVEQQSGDFLPLAGGTMEGSIIMPSQNNAQMHFQTAHEGALLSSSIGSSVYDGEGAISMVTRSLDIINPNPLASQKSQITVSEPTGHVAISPKSVFLAQRGDVNSQVNIGFVENVTDPENPVYYPGLFFSVSSPTGSVYFPITAYEGGLTIGSSLDTQSVEFNCPALGHSDTPTMSNELVTKAYVDAAIAEAIANLNT